MKSMAVQGLMGITDTGKICAMRKIIERSLEQYAGKVTRVGNFKGVRVDAAFFKAHPEFNGDVRVTVLADGLALLSAETRGRRRSTSEDADPVMLGFLRFLQKQMTEHPDQIASAHTGQLRRIGKLVKDVKG